GGGPVRPGAAGDRGQGAPAGVLRAGPPGARFPPHVSPARPSQVTLRTAFTVCFAVVATAALVLFLYETRLALTITVAAVMLAVALDPDVHLRQARRPSPAGLIPLTRLGG